MDPGANRCPLCGAEKDSARCPGCGAVAPETSRSPIQPAFELGWEGARPAGLLARGFKAIALAGETAGALALRPESSFRSFRARGGAWAPVAYAILLGGPCLLLGALLRVRLGAAAGADPMSRHAVRLLPALFLVLALPPIYVYVRSHALHLGLVIAGRARESFLATFRVSAYANASAAPLLLIPFAGEFLFLLWGSYLEATGVRFAHGLTPAAAAAAEALPAVMMALALGAAAAIGFLSWTQAPG